MMNDNIFYTESECVYEKKIISIYLFGLLFVKNVSVMFLSILLSNSYLNQRSRIKLLFNKINTKYDIFEQYLIDNLNVERMLDVMDEGNDCDFSEDSDSDSEEDSDSDSEEDSDSASDSEENSASDSEEKFGFSSENSLESSTHSEEHQTEYDHNITLKYYHFDRDYRSILRKRKSNENLPNDNTIKGNGWVLEY